MAKKRRHTSLEVELTKTVRVLTKLLVVMAIIVLGFSVYLNFLN